MFFLGLEGLGFLLELFAEGDAIRGHRLEGACNGGDTVMREMQRTLNTPIEADEAAVGPWPKHENEMRAEAKMWKPKEKVICRSRGRMTSIGD